jgi:antitoxin MazE6
MVNTIKTAISLKKELFEKVNKLARDLNISRSRLFVLAVQHYIKEIENRNMLTEINNAFSDPADPEEIIVQGKMRKKQIENMDEESW